MGKNTGEIPHINQSVNILFKKVCRIFVTWTIIRNLMSPGNSSLLAEDFCTLCAYIGQILRKIRCITEVN